MPRVRRLTDSVIASILIMISSYVFMTTIPFLPGAPVIPLIISLILGVLYFRLPGYSDTFLALIVFFSIAWQFLGFVLPPSPSTSNVNWQVIWLSTAAILAILALNMLSGIFEPLAVSSAALASALLLTDYFYLAPILLVMPSLVRGVGSIVPTAYSFIATSLPLIILENALRGSGDLPVLISKLAYLGENLRKPIPSLNVFVSGIPQDVISDRWRDVVTYLGGGGVLTLIAPLISLSISFVFAAIVTRGVLRLYDSMPQLESREIARRATRPLIASLTSVGVFSILLLSLSPRNIGGYKTGFGDDPASLEYLFVGAILLGALFSAKEIVLIRLEASEEAREALREAIAEGERRYASLSSMIKLILSRAPYIDLSEETRELEEIGAALRDTRARLSIAKKPMLDEALSRIRTTYMERIREMDVRLRSRVAEEILELDSACKKCNYSLKEAGVRENLLPEISELPRTEDLENLLNLYSEYIGKIRSSVAHLYELYVKSIESTNRLFGDASISPPQTYVNPLSLMNTGSYVDAIELLAGLWKSLQENIGPRLVSACPNILETVSRLESVLRGKDLEMLKTISDSIKDSCRGVGGVLGLEKQVEELRKLLLSALEWAIKDLEKVKRVEGLLERLDPQAVRGLELRSPKLVSELQEIRKEVMASEVSLSSIVSLTSIARNALWNYIVSIKEDEAKILILSQYQLARAIIDSIISTRGGASIDDLPFTPNASEVYARIYSRSTRNIVYSEDEAVIKVAKM
ncbi:MAG: hypothetical protein RQ885_13085 [Desulfurococcales archaeon]|nr:hypothetical protein [Desulfurococcales archaeon]